MACISLAALACTLGFQTSLVDGQFGPWTKSQAGLVSCLEPYKNTQNLFEVAQSTDFVFGV